MAVPTWSTSGHFQDGLRGSELCSMFRTRRSHADSPFGPRSSSGILSLRSRTGPRRAFPCGFVWRTAGARSKSIHLDHAERDDQFILWSRPLCLPRPRVVIVTPPTPLLIFELPVLSSQLLGQDHSPDRGVPGTVSRGWTGVECACSDRVGEDDPKVGSPCRRCVLDRSDQRADIQLLRNGGIICVIPVDVGGTVLYIALIGCLDWISAESQLVRLDSLGLIFGFFPRRAFF